ncbi:calcium-activated chloride channel-domain-containing protein [Emericellopsis atlantica]|uniref:Calcium-activated chloride channel-domain-containing protein n=1 Tax=Emericellopsis atlantica TaxID=2614577 RepID=A0A9P8CTH8_9HYPO|nr:calcium-activated chloride channel-domain-containing protein [Emericellopsis atlantica]KAG9258853.1 calcium-activated chloride channel-domain-containing protein [Emericellopsis atlantica]
MSTLKGLYGKRDDGGVESNYGVDYVVHHKIPAAEREAAEAAFIQLITALTKVGLATEVRHGDGSDLLVFVKIASPDYLAKHVYRARLQDWLQGVRSNSPNKDISQALEDEPVTEAERSRLVYLILTKPTDDGGAGITPGNGSWKYVESIFPLHNHAFNKAWIQKWSRKYLLDQSDLDEIRNKFGEDVAFYFAFTQSYFRFLIFPSAVGLTAWLFFGQFSKVYALLSCLWSVVFFEYWKKKELDLAISWGVRGVSNIQRPRPEFEWEYEKEDAVTGEKVKVYDPMKRLKTQLLQVPFALACVTVLGGLVVTCNSLEVFINEVYTGPGKQFLPFLPTAILCTMTPLFSGVLMKAAETLTTWENYENVDAYNAALVQKQFVLNFMTSYMALLFTTFVYIPFGHILVPFLNFWQATAETLTFSEKPLPTKTFEINPARISSQMFYFTVTAQIVNFATEVVVPYVKRQAADKAKEFQQKDKPKVQDHPEEAEFLQRVRHECELETYDVSGDYREMVIQYGYLALFSVAWPLASTCFLINNWFELRSDAVKIAISSRRPIPWRADSIGPWMTALGFLSWLGSVTSSAIVFLCSGSQDGARGTTSHITLAGALGSIMFAEHFYFVVQLVVRHVMSKLESPGVQQERKERYMMKKRMLEETLGQTVEGKDAVPGLQGGEETTREALEEEARKQSIHGHGSPEEAYVLHLPVFATANTNGSSFWQRQRGMNETITMGRRMIEQSVEEKSKSQKPAPSPQAQKEL